MRLILAALPFFLPLAALAAEPPVPPATSPITASPEYRALQIGRQNCETARDQVTTIALRTADQLETLTAQVADLTKTKDALTAQVADLTKQLAAAGKKASPATP